MSAIGKDTVMVYITDATETTADKLFASFSSSFRCPVQRTAKNHRTCMVEFGKPFMQDGESVFENRVCLERFDDANSPAAIMLMASGIRALTAVPMRVIGGIIKEE